MEADAPKPPASALPAHMTNGSPLRLTTEARHKKERENLFNAIETSNRGRQVVNFDGPTSYFPAKASAAKTGVSGVHDTNTMAVNGVQDAEGEAEHVVAQTPLATSRAHSPYSEHARKTWRGKGL